MITNIGIIDAAVRLVIGALLLEASDGYFGHPAPWLGWLLYIIGAALALTGLLRYCPIYAFSQLTSCAPYCGRIHRENTTQHVDNRISYRSLGRQVERDRDNLAGKRSG